MGRKVGTFLLALLGCAVLTPGIVSANESSPFDRLKILVGEWEGTNSAGPVKVTYTLVAGGSALMERLQSANEPEMITMYSADGDRILITHYCSAGNQPQLKTQMMTGKAEKYTFTLVRVTGMKTQDEGHMVGLVLSFPDKNHLTQEWKYRNNKGKTSANLFQFKRKPENAATIVPSGN
ncbi:MAG: hypothetical protein AUH96_13055 [Nitrospirae bacterium 13_2_20CM_2_61_4]|nr:MAG: hypothetical protein AUH96_13055 [Nitrospirae bacterium 13_2_20CM_2_61_4]